LFVHLRSNSYLPLTLLVFAFPVLSLSYLLPLYSSSFLPSKPLSLITRLHRDNKVAALPSAACACVFRPN
jgi:hypothetical protein